MTYIVSNEPWLGRVPSDWTRSRIRNVAEISPGFSDDPPRSDELCTVVPMERLFDDGTIDLSIQVPHEDIQSGLTLFESGDVLFAKITPCMENGKGAFVRELPTRYAFGSTEFHVLRPRSQINGKFLYYYTYNPAFRDYAAENMTGAAGLKRVSSRFIKDTRIFLPTLQEQKSIVKYLDVCCAIIDKLALFGKKNENLSIKDGVLNNQIAALIDYRKSLIHECVTGQRRITEEDVARAQKLE